MIDFRRAWDRLLGRDTSRRDPAVEREIDEELSFHLDMRTRENIASGMEPEAARRCAMERLGEIDSVRRRGYAIRRPGRGLARSVARLFDDLRRDLAFAARGMARAPGFAAIAVLALTLGIGASTAVFSIVNDVLLDAVPYENADRLVDLVGRSISRQAMPAFRNDLATLDGVAFWHLDSHELVGPEGAQDVRPVMVDEAFLSVVGVQPVLGRGFSPDDHAADAPDVVLLSDALWRASFG
ncbi:MAG TPA: permease prefix domain 1-containing protein, partial [Acidobacteriota bacterium]